MKTINKYAMLLFACAIVISCSNTAIKIGRNIHVSTELSNFPHAETHLAVNPNDPKQMIIAAMVYKEKAGKDYPVLYYTMDGGKNWALSEIKGDFDGAVDPWVIYDNNKFFYLHLPGAVHVSEDYGKSFESGKLIADLENNSFDFMKIVASKSSHHLFALGTNNIKNENGGKSIDPISVIKIDKDLKHFSEVINIRPELVNYKNGTPITLDNGKLIVPYYELLDLNRDILQNNPIWISQMDEKTLKVEASYRTELTGGEISLALNHKFGNRLHLVSFTRVGNGFKLQYSHSNDFGESWTDPKFIEDFERDPNSHALSASISVSNNGIVGILWPDHRTDPSNENYGMYFMYSKDGGETFSKSYLISEITSPFTQINSNTFVGNSGRSVAERFWVGGDYYGLDSTGDSSFQASWVDSRTGVAQVWTCMIQI